MIFIKIKKYIIIIIFISSFIALHNFVFSDEVAYASEQTALYLDLFKAIDANNVEKVKEILKVIKPSEINKNHPNAERGYYTPLRIAVMGNKKEIIGLLIDHGADVNLYCSFCDAIDTNDLNLVKLLFDKGAKINKDISLSLAKGAAEVGNVDILKLLMEHGVDIMTAAKDENYNPLIAAAGSGKTEMVEFLINKGLKVNSGDMSALHEASYYGHLGVVKVLIKNGADVNRKDFGGVTPIDYAAYHDYKDVVKYLVENGAYETFFSAVVTENFLKLKQLIEKGQNINEKIRFHGETPLHLAVEINSVNSTKALLLNGADPNIRDNEGKTPLHYAVGATPENLLNTMTNEATKGNVEIVKLLLEHGANPNLRDYDKQTPLDYAQRLNEPEIIYLLKKYMKKEM